MVLLKNVFFLMTLELLIISFGEPIISVNSTTASLGDWLNVTWDSDSLQDSLWSARTVSEGETTRWLDAGCWVGLFPWDASFDVIHERKVDYSPRTATAPWRFVPCDDAKNGSAGETLYFEFSMDAPVRTDVVFALFDGGYSKPVLVSRSQIVDMKDKSQPSNVHLVRQQDPSVMSVQWTSLHGTDAPQYVRWSTKQHGHSNEAMSSFSTFTRSDVCGPPANDNGFLDPGFAHEAFMTQLQPGVRYYYTIGDKDHGWSLKFSFKGPQLASHNSTTFVVLTADVGVTYEDRSTYQYSHIVKMAARNTTARLAQFADRADLVLHLGDLPYALGVLSLWDKFMTAIQPTASKVPYMITKGNHEQLWLFQPPGQPDTAEHAMDSGGECGVPCDHHFRMPLKESANKGFENVTAAHGFYSFNQGPIHFAMLNTEMSCDPTSNMTRWLESDLAAVDRLLTPWLVVVGHRPMYDAANITSCERIEPLLIMFKVDLAIWGHVHYAEVTCPMVDGFCVTKQDAAGYDAPVHVIIGNGGPTDTKFPATPPPYDIFQQPELGFQTLEAHNATHLTMTFYGDSPPEDAPPVRFQLRLERAYPRVN